MNAVPASAAEARPNRIVLALYVASAVLITFQQAVLRHSNNLRIFRTATYNLIAGRDLYAANPEQHFDYYKYSPTFALLFAPFALASTLGALPLGRSAGVRSAVQRGDDVVLEVGSGRYSFAVTRGQ